MSAKEMKDHFAKVDWQEDPAYTHVARRECRHPNGQDCGANERARVLIQPDKGMHLVEYDDFPPEGRIVARMWNYDGLKTEKRFKVPPKAWVYWVVERVGPTEFRSRYFFLLGWNANELKPPGSEASRWERCGHRGDNRVASARFQECPEVARASHEHDTPGWSSCGGQGCCISGVALGTKK